MTTPKPKTSDFQRWHRAASEYLLLGVTDDDNVLEHLAVAEGYERQALDAATNVREKLLAVGLMNTLETVRQTELDRGSNSHRTPRPGMSTAG